MSRHLPQSLCRLQSRAHSAAPPPKMLHLLHSNERGERKREREKGGGEDMCPHSQTLTQKQHLNTTYVKARNSLTQTSTGADSTEQRLISLRGAFRAAIRHHVSAVRLQTQRTDGGVRDPVSRQRLWTSAELHLLFLLLETETHRKDVAVYRVYYT